MTTSTPVKISLDPQNGSPPQVIESRNFMLVFTDEANGILIGGVVDGAPLNDWHKVQRLYELALTLTQSDLVEVKLLGEQTVALIRGWESGVRIAARGGRAEDAAGDEETEG